MFTRQRLCQPELSLQTAAESVCPVCDPCPAINGAADYTGAKNIVQCAADLITLSAVLPADFTATCPSHALCGSGTVAPCQATIDSMYKNCDGGADWATEKAAWKSLTERKGCGGAAQAMPAIALVVAAVSGPKSQPHPPRRGSDDPVRRL